MSDKAVVGLKVNCNLEGVSRKAEVVALNDDGTCDLAIFDVIEAGSQKHHHIACGFSGAKPATTPADHATPGTWWA